MIKSLKYLALASAIWMSNPFSVFAIESAWSLDAAGNWNTTADWNNGVPGTNGASGDIADLTYDISANRTITLTNNLVLATLNIGDPSGNARYMPSPIAYTIAFNNNGAGAWLVKTQGLTSSYGEEIDCTAALADMLTISNSTGMLITFWHPISGATGCPLVKDGAGVVQLVTGRSSYAGGTLIKAGTLQAGTATALSGGEFGTGTVTNRAFLALSSSGTGSATYTNNFVFDGGTNYDVDGNYRLGTNYGSSSSTITVTSPSTVQRAWGHVTVKYLALNGLLQGSAGLTLQGDPNNGNAGEGSSVWVNNSNNTYSGTITINANSGKSGGGFAMVVGTNLALQTATVNVQGTPLGGDGGTPKLLYGVCFASGVAAPVFGGLSGNGNFVLTNLSGNSPVALTVGGNSGSTTFSGVLSGSGSLTKVGNGALTLSGPNTYSGTNLVSAGKLTISAASTITNTITVADGAAFGVSASGINQLAPSILTLGSSTGATNEFSGLSSATVAPLKPGTLVVNGTCKISIVSGAFVAGNSYPLITNSSVGGATFSLASQPLGVSGNLSNKGHVLYYNVTGVLPTIWTGATDANWDWTTANWAFNNLPTAYKDNNSVQFDDNGANTSVTIPSAVSPGSVMVTNSSQTYSFSGAAITGAASLTKTGNGILMFNNTNTFTGGVAVNGGTLIVSANNAYTGGTVVNSGGTLDLGIGGQVGAIRGALTVNSGGYANLAAGNSLGYGPGVRVETVNANGGLIEATVAGDQGWNTTFNLTGGELRANGGYSSVASSTYFTLGNDAGGSDGVNTFASATSSVISGRLQLRKDNQTNVTFNVADGAAAVDLLVSAAITQNDGPVGIIKAGAGTMDLAGVCTNTGPTIVNAGTLLVDGMVGSAGVAVTNATLGGLGTIGGPVTLGDNATLAPGINGYGVLTVSSLTNNASSTNLITLRKTGGVTTNCSLVVSGPLAYGGTLMVQTSAGDDALVLGDSFQIFNAGSSSGAFTTTTLPATPSGTTWDFAGGKLTVVLLNAASMPTFNPGSGGFIGAQQVIISSATTGSTINYSQDGSTWSSGATPVVITVPVNTNLTLYAYASKTGYAVSITNSATYATLDHGTWINSSGGSWPVSGNWSNGVVATGSGVTADFSTLALGADANVTLDGARTVGELLFNDLNDASDTFSWTLSTTGPLGLDASNNIPVISVGLDSDAYGYNNSAILSCTVAGTNGFVKTGPGNLTLSSSGNMFSGDLTVSNGTLSVSATSSSSSTNSALGAKVGGRNVVIKSYALWTIQNVFGGSGLNATNLPTLVVSGGTNDATRWNPLGNIVLNGGTLNQNATDSGGYEGWQFLGTVSVTGSAPSYITTGNGKANHLLNTGNIFDVANVTGDAQSDLIISAPLRNSSGDYTPTNTGILVKTGVGTLELAGANTYTGPTIVSNGTLLVSGSIASGGTVTVVGGTLCGNGTISSPVTVQSGGTLEPSTNSSDITTLNLSGTTLTLGGNVIFHITANGLASDQVNGLLSSVQYGGTLTVTDIDNDTSALVAGDTFTLFPNSSTAYSGLFTSYNLPTLSAGLSWDKSQLTVNGTISVANTTATPLFSIAGGTYFSALSVSIYGDTGSTIHYSTDGGTTWLAGTAGAGSATVSIPMNANITITAHATMFGYTQSPDATANYLTQPEAVWTSTAGGSWAAAGNWLNNAIGNGSGVTADFNTLTLTANTTVPLDSTPTIGNLKFGDNGSNYNWFVTSGTGGPLTIDAGAILPLITVSNMTTTIGNVLAGTNGLVKNGAGTLTLAANNTYTGTTVVSNGTLVLNAGGGAGAIRGTLTINSGTTVICQFLDALGYTVGQNLGTINVNGGTLTNATAVNQGFNTDFNLTGGTIAGVGGSYNISGGHTISSLASSTMSVFSSSIQLRNTTTNVINVALGSVPGGTDFNISGNIFENTGVGSGITKTGAGRLALSGYNSYTGPTTVSNGTLFVDGTIVTSAVTVNGGTLGGAGTINGPVTVNAGCTLSPGNTNIGRLTIGNVLSLAGTASFRLSKSGSVLTNDQVAGLTSVAYSGTLTVTAAGDALAGGDAFTLFSGGTKSGSFAATNLPTLGSGMAWQWNASAGTLSVIATVNTNPTNISYTVSGNQLTLGWPSDHTGWTLQSQTNSLSTGLSGTWHPVSGSTTTNQMIINIDPSKPAVFYRLTY
jgi:autotransporter-associated beta strand protein